MKYLISILSMAFICACCSTKQKKVAIKNITPGIVIDTDFEINRNTDTTNYYIIVQGDSDIITHNVSWYIYDYLNVGDTIQ